MESRQRRASFPLHYPTKKPSKLPPKFRKLFRNGLLHFVHKGVAADATEELIQVLVVLKEQGHALFAALFGLLYKMEMY